MKSPGLSVGVARFLVILEEKLSLKPAMIRMARQPGKWRAALEVRLIINIVFLAHLLACMWWQPESFLPFEMPCS